MTTVKSRTWPLAEATEVAENLITLLRPACERIEVAGSVRRKKNLVGDVELLAISKTAPVYLNLTPDWPCLEFVHLDARVLEMIAAKILDYRLNKRGSKTYGRWNKLLVHVPSGIPVDLFATTPSMWGLALLVRTGSKAFNIRVMQRCKQLGLRGHAYSPIEDGGGNPLPCESEDQVFRLLQWDYIAPDRRG
jgi:DNA polymerase (family 10)